MEKGNNRLTEIVAKIIDQSEDRDRIRTGWVVEQTYQRIDPKNIAPRLVKLGCLQALAQIARGLLRGKYESGETDKSQHELWPDLQRRYPIAHRANSEPEYVKLEDLTTADIRWNLKNLQKQADGSMRHLRALRQWALTHGHALDDEVVVSVKDTGVNQKRSTRAVIRPS